jgi:hypothetical protein
MTVLNLSKMPLCNGILIVLESHQRIVLVISSSFPFLKNKHGDTTILGIKKEVDQNGKSSKKEYMMHVGGVSMCLHSLGKLQ